MRSLLAAAVLAGCSTASEPFQVDLILRHTQEPAYEFGDTVVRLTVRGSNLCAHPRGKLGGVDLPPTFVVEGDRVTLEESLGPAMWKKALAHDHVADCTFVDTVELALDCSGQEPRAGIRYRTARATVPVVVQRTAALDAILTPTHVQTSRLTQFAADTTSKLDPTSLGAFTVAGVTVAPILAAPRGTHLGRVVVAPPEPLAPGLYAVRLAGGAGGIRGAAGECLSSAELRTEVVVRREDPPRFAATIRAGRRRRGRGEGGRRGCRAVRARTRAVSG